MLLSYACTTVYEQQVTCTNHDWYATGFDIAKSGYGADAAWDKEVSSCLKQKMWADREAYDKGYALGLETFCTRSNGFEFGQRNLSYEYICGEEKQGVFNLAYSDGEKLHAVNLDVESYENELINEQNKTTDAKQRRKELAYTIKHADLDKKTKKKYVKKRYDLKQKLYGAEGRITALRSKLRESQRLQSKLEFTLFEKYYTDDSQINDISLDASVTRESITINQPAIIIYQPVSMDGEIKKHFKLTTKEINKSVAEVGNSQFRYQMVGEIKLEFVRSESNAFLVQTGTVYTQPMLLLWDGNELQPEGYNFRNVEELTAMVTQFIQEN